MLQRLDPSIQHHKRKTGISLVHNIYARFDTEFHSDEFGLNTLISTQLAINKKTFVKIPRVLNYQNFTVVVNTKKIHKQTKNYSVFNYSKIEGSIYMCVNNIRRFKYGTYDVSMLILNETLRFIKGFKLS